LPFGEVRASHCGEQSNSSNRGFGRQRVPLARRIIFLKCRDGGQGRKARLRC
jgi:hypothetical protein